MKRFAFFVLVFVVLGFSVYGQSTARVYIAGSFTDVATQRACYWVDGTRVVLPDGYSAKRIAVENGIVYVAGIFGRQQICYWVDGVKHDLDSTVSLNDMAVTDGRVRVYGRSSNGPYTYGHLWVDGVYQSTTAIQRIVISDGIAYFLLNRSYAVYGQQQSLDLGPDDRFGSLSGITVVNGRVYVSGVHYAYNRNDSTSSYTPCYWVDGTRVNLSQPSRSTNLYSGAGYSTSGIAVVNGNVYVSGSYLQNPNDRDTTIACYWVNSTKTDLNGNQTFGIAVANGNVYVIGNYKQGTLEIPCYWVDGVRRALPGAMSVNDIIAVTE